MSSRAAARSRRPLRRDELRQCIERTEHQVKIPADLRTNEKNAVDEILKQIDQEKNYRKYYFPSADELKVFMNGGGSVVVNLISGKLLFENLVVSFCLPNSQSRRQLSSQNG